MKLRSNKLKQLIGEEKGFECDSGRVTWSRGVRTSFDSKRLKEELPDIYERYATQRPADYGIRFSKRKGKK